MTYTESPPTEPGYYWLQTKDGEEIVEVWIDPAEAQRHFWVHRCGDGEGCILAEMVDAQWAGPIPKPG